MGQKLTLKDKSLPLMLKRIQAEHPNNIAYYFRPEKDAGFIGESYTEFYEHVLNTAASFMQLGVNRDDKVLLISDNRRQWQWVTLGLLSIGAIDVSRGSDATTVDIKNILNIVNCRIAVLENEYQVEKILDIVDENSFLEKLILFDDFDFSELKTQYPKLEFLSFNDFYDNGKLARKNAVLDPEPELAKASVTDTAAIIFTSGTTGIPKGVILSHQNFLVQIPELSERLHITGKARILSVLPIWHSFEREIEYITMYNAATLVYSKPIPSVLMPDITEMEPSGFPSVPRIWEVIYDSVYKKMRKAGGITFAIFNLAFLIGGFWKRQQLKLTGRLIETKIYQRITHPLFALLPTVFLSPFYLLFDILVFRKLRKRFGKNWNIIGGVSGGGALPQKVDSFFSTAGLVVLEGYGITELAPVVAVRSQEKATQGTVGKPLAFLDIKICDNEGRELPKGKVGTIFLRGPSVTSGYYKNPEKTAEALDDDGWFNTGDLGMLTLDGELAITGREKDTIVLLGGENIEPVPIEMKLEESPYIKTAMVVGQDQRYLASLIVVDADSLKAWATENNINIGSLEDLVNTDEVQRLYSNQINSLISPANGFKIFERIFKFKLLTKEFEVGKELSIKMEIARHKVNKIYEKQIKEFFAR